MDMLGYKSLQEVAEDLGMNRGNLYRIFMLQTSPGVETLPSLCRTLHVPLIELMKVLEVIEQDAEL